MSDPTAGELIAQAAEIHVKLAELQHAAAVSDAIGAILQTHQLKDEAAARAILGQMVRQSPTHPATVQASAFLAAHPDSVTDNRLTDEAKLARQTELRARGIL